MTEVYQSDIDETNVDNGWIVREITIKSSLVEESKGYKKTIHVHPNDDPDEVKEELMDIFPAGLFDQ